jgi:hypothetical protein
MTVIEILMIIKDVNTKLFSFHLHIRSQSNVRRYDNGASKHVVRFIHL